MLDWSKVKQNTPIVIRKTLLREPYVARFSHYEDGRVFYFEHSFTGPDLTWKIKAIKSITEKFCSTNRVLNTNDFMRNFEKD